MILRRDRFGAIELSTVNKGAYIFSTSFMLIHVYLFFFFRKYGVTPMAVFNIFSITFYAVMLFVIYRGHLRFFLIAMYLEVLAHMGLSVVFVGWNSGFQITIIGMTLVMFYAEYICKTLIQGNPHAMFLSIIGTFVYLGTLIYTHISPPRYTLPEDVSFYLNLMWGISVFGTEIACLQFFVYMTTKSEEKLAGQATTDKLTGLYNRRGYDRIVRSIDISKTVLLLADGDKFKEVNDSFGHEAGDTVLKRIAGAFKDHFRSQDCVCRIGGDEFAILVEADNIDVREMIIHKVTAINKELANAPEGGVAASISVGAAFGSESESMDDLLNKADKALYSVKNSGGCGIAFYSEI